MTPPHPQMDTTKEIFGCPWFRVHEERWETISDLNEQPFYRIESSDGVLVLAVTKERKIILVRQFRPAIRRTSLEFPAGNMEEGETPEDAAARELLEESGYRPGTVHLLGSGHIMMNRYSAREYFLMAQNCEKSSSGFNESKQDVLLVSPPEFKDLVTSGSFEHIPALSLLSLAEWKFGSRLVV